MIESARTRQEKIKKYILICKCKLIMRCRAAERRLATEKRLVLDSVNLDKANVSEIFKIGAEEEDEGVGEETPPYSISSEFLFSLCID